MHLIKTTARRGHKEIKALEFLNQALFNFEIYTVNRELMKINVTDSDFDRKSFLRDSILIKKE